LDASTALQFNPLAVLPVSIDQVMVWQFKRRCGSTSSDDVADDVVLDAAALPAPGAVTSDRCDHLSRCESFGNPVWLSGATLFCHLNCHRRLVSRCCCCCN